jgi:cell division septation protein DedD
MARDFAKGKQAGKRKTPAKKPATRGSQAPRGGGWRLFGAGVLSGVFLSFLAYLGTLPDSGQPPPAAGAGEPEAQPPKPRFDFYTLLPQQRLEVEPEPRDIEPAADVADPRPVSAARDVYLLQAGSFRQRDDADRRRAELLLLGLEPSVEETNSDNGRWYRVYLGPFESRSEMASARGLTANQDIDTLLLKRSLP